MKLNRMAPVVVLAGLLPSLWGSGARASSSALKDVPYDATLIVTIPSLSAVDADFQWAVKTFELQPFLPPGTTSLVGLLKAQLPFLNGLDESGALSIVVMPPQHLFEIDQRQILMIPAKDPKAMIAAMNGQAGEDGIWSATLMGQAMFLAATERHVIVGPARETVRAVKERRKSAEERLSKDERSAAEGLDLLIWLDAAKLIELAKPMIDGFLMPVLATQEAQGGWEAKYAKANKQNLDMFFNGASSLLLGVKINEVGVDLRLAMRSKPDSKLSATMKVQNTSGPLLRGLPADGFILATGAMFHPEQLQASVDSLDVLLEPAKDEATSEEAKGLRAKFKEIVPLLRDVRLSLSVLEPGPDGIVGAVALMDTSDGPKVLRGLEDIVNLAKKLLGTWSKEGFASLGPWLETLTYTADAEEVAGVKVHRLGLDLSRVENAKAHDEQIRNVIGGEGLMMRLAAIENSVVCAFGGGRNRFEAVLRSARSGHAPIEQQSGVQLVAGQLPSERASVTYVVPHRAFQLVNLAAKALEEEALPVQVPPLEEPLAISLAGGGGLIRYDCFLPTSLIRAIKNAAVQFSAPKPAQPAVAPNQPVEPSSP